MSDKALKKLKKEIKKDILNFNKDSYSIANMKDDVNKEYFVVYNDRWPELDKELVNPDPEGRMIVRKYGNGFAHFLLAYRDAINDIFKTTSSTFKIYSNEDILIYNEEYRIRITRNIDMIKKHHKESGQYLVQ